MIFSIYVFIGIIFLAYYYYLDNKRSKNKDKPASYYSLVSLLGNDEKIVNCIMYIAVVLFWPIVFIGIIERLLGLQDKDN